MNLLALSALAAYIVTGITPVSAVSLTSNVHAARHVSLAHTGLIKRNSHKNTKRCGAPQQHSAPHADAPAPAPAPAPVAPAPDGGNNNNAATNSGVNTWTQGSTTYNGPATSGKKGAAWPNGPNNLDKWSKGIHWLYTWSPDCPSNSASLGIECVPMLWGWQHLENFKSKTSQPDYARTALGMNEPDLFGNGDLSSGISPESAVDLWLQGMQPLKARGYRLGSPATTSAPAGKDWMHNFLNTCGGRCTVDFIAVHFYDRGVQKFIDYVTDWHNTFNSNIWVTEFACQNFNGGDQCSDGEIWDFLTGTVSWMESTSWVERYSWFGTLPDMVNVNAANQLMSSDGGVNALGTKYLEIS